MSAAERSLVIKTTVLRDYLQPLAIGVGSAVVTAMTIVWIQGSWSWPTFWTASQAIVTTAALIVAFVVWKAARDD